MADQEIKININLDALLGELQIALQETTTLVAIGLSAPTDIETGNLFLPTFFKHEFAKLNWTQEETRTKYQEWILSNGFRDMIEQVGSFLESAHRVISLWEIQRRQMSGERITFGEIKAIFSDVGNKFHRLGIPDKLSHLSEDHGISIDQKHIERLISINAARNCFVHRRGIVSDRDAKINGKLIVRWIYLHCFLTDEDGEKELVPGERVEKDSTVCLRVDENSKEFLIGDELNFDVEEFAQIAFGIFLIGKNLVAEIAKFGASIKQLDNGPREET